MTMQDRENLVFDLFKDYEIYLVGGYVRDKLLGVESHDLDFATNARPEETKKILENAELDPHTVGWAFGTVGFIHKRYEFHITTYRKNEDYQRDNRHPVVEWGNTLEEDLSRRDFTINAIAQDKDGKIIDLFEGQKHLEDKIIKTPGSAEKAFREDPLRILRAIRFANKLNFTYNGNTWKALNKFAYKVLTLSKERILEEFTKILLVDFAACALHDMLESRVLHYIAPELTVLADIEQDSEYHHKNAWEHTIQVVSEIKKSPINRWAALFHDIGKPYTYSIENGKIHFYKHEEISARMTESILKRIGLPNKWIKAIIFMVRNHMRPNLYDKNWSTSAVRRFVREMGHMLEPVLDLSRADITSHKPLTVDGHLARISELSERCEEAQEYKELKCPLTGYDIMNYYKIKPGPEVGKMQKIIIEALLSSKLNQVYNKQIYFAYLDEERNKK